MLTLMNSGYIAPETLRRISRSSRLLLLVCSHSYHTSCRRNFSCQQDKIILLLLFSLKEMLGTLDTHTHVYQISS